MILKELVPGQYVDKFSWVWGAIWPVLNAVSSHYTCSSRHWTYTSASKLLGFSTRVNSFQIKPCNVQE